MYKQVSNNDLRKGKCSYNIKNINQKAGGRTFKFKSV